MKVRVNMFACLLGAFCANGAVAETNAGIDFGAMPVGCRWERQMSNGQVWLEEYIGKQGTSYVIRATNAKNPSELVSTTEFNKDGHRTKLTWANGSWSTFTPFSCFAVVGKCSYTYQNSDGASSVIKSVAKLKGSVLSTVSSSGGTEYAPERTELGPFRIWISNKSSEYWTKVTKFENCGQLPAS